MPSSAFDSHSASVTHPHPAGIDIPLEELRAIGRIQQMPSQPTQTGKLVVALCTYNEKENIAELVPEILNLVPMADILVVDDNSPDGTGRLADEFAAKDPRVHAIHRAGKLGLGTAMIAAFDWAMSRGYEYIQFMDADYSHPPRFLPSIIEAGKNVDVAIGSRYIPGGGIEGWGLKRHFMSRSINAFARLMLGLKTKDNSGNYRCYRVGKLAEIDWSKAICKGYGLQEELLYRLNQAGATFAEVPITFEERRFGSSKINWKEAVDAGLTILKLPFSPSATRQSEHDA